MSASLTFICQLIALACFFIGWMNWSLPKGRQWNWTTGGFFWVLLSLMIGGIGIVLHQATTH